MCYSNPCFSLGTEGSNIFYLNPNLLRLLYSFQPSTGRNRLSPVDFSEYKTGCNSQHTTLLNLDVKCSCPDLNIFGTM